ncbi:MAG TPA: ROK family transcriptional regulator [Actinomycetota bacterium]|nr:ROK family transcriptional regulator [Actinomycetota bacterium]
MRGGGTADHTFAAGTPSLLKAINERSVLEFVRQMGPVSRAQIARDSDLSKPTVSQALAELLGAGLVREAGRSSGGRGPAAVLYELNPRAGWVVGLDVGRDFVRAAIANLAGEIVARRDERARVRSQRTLISQVGDVSHALAAEAGVRWKQVTFATVGSPGVFDPVTGHVALAHALPGWGRSGLAQAVQDELGTKVAFENDVNLAALGEQWLGLGKGVENFVYLHVGTGVGAGLILRGELYRGHTGAAGEVGYLPIGGDPRDKVLRRRGVLDTEAGASGVVATARRLGMEPPLSPRKVFAAARRGDRIARRVVELEADRIALAAAAIVPIVDPELVVLGGGIGRNGDLLLEPVTRALRAMTPFAVRLEVSPLGEEAVVLGAVWLALQAAQDLLFTRTNAMVVA